MPNLAPRVRIISWIPQYGEVKYLIGDKKYVAVGLSPVHFRKVENLVKHGANNQAIQYLKYFDVARETLVDTRTVAQELARIAKILVGAKKPSKDELVQFFVDNPNPKDDKVHAFAEKLGVEPDVLESEIYKLATIAAEFLGDGRSNEKGLTEDDVDAKELKMGIEVEKEHTPNTDITKRIALDHLAEFGDYYTRLKKMEDEAKKAKE